MRDGLGIYHIFWLVLRVRDSIMNVLIVPSAIVALALAAPVSENYSYSSYSSYSSSKHGDQYVDHGLGYGVHGLGHELGHHYGAVHDLHDNGYGHNCVHNFVHPLGHRHSLSSDRHSHGFNQGHKGGYGYDSGHGTHSHSFGDGIHGHSFGDGLGFGYNLGKHDNHGFGHHTFNDHYGDQGNFNHKFNGYDLLASLSLCEYRSYIYL